MNDNQKFIQSLAGWAAHQDAVVLTDAVGDIAVQRRHYDDDGVRILRHRPDPADFRMPILWAASRESERQGWIC